MACTAWSDAWGVPMSPLSSTNPCNTGSTLDTSFYTGSRRDQITGDYQFGVRTYDPSTGSFLEPDTYLGSQPGSQGSVVSDPLTLNRYVYVNGDPLNLIDPSGHMAIADGSGGGSGYSDNNTPASANNYSNQGGGGLGAVIAATTAAVDDYRLRCIRDLTCRLKCPPLCPASATNDNPDGGQAQDQIQVGTAGCGTNLVSAITPLSADQSIAGAMIAPAVQSGVGAVPGLGIGLRIPVAVSVSPRLSPSACVQQNTNYNTKGKGPGGGGPYPPRRFPLGPGITVGGIVAFLVLIGFVALAAIGGTCMYNSCTPAGDPGCEPSPEPFASGTRVLPQRSPHGPCPTPDKIKINNPEA
jgi:RHS repeat-associated protein